ncbi:sensor histidine kinase [Parapedobacter sp. 10938]|uniref:sensor histidine kinase n=1 Tax=Parapedobacter flavus TaxID=3110225 RepID=UPI002DBEAEA3|nr:histidine kinase [Parapedobacter sp. 10938]MEC3880607.1 histidine kinase [Parapedobacter sp. 10938]
MQAQSTNKLSEFNWFNWYTPKTRVVCHVIFWLLVLLFYTLNYRRIAKDVAWVFILKDMIVVLTIFYGTTSFVISNWLLKGKWLLTFFWVVFGYLLWAAGTYAACFIIVNYFPASGNYLKFFFDLVLSNGPLGMVYPHNVSVLALDYVFLVTLPLSPKLMKSLMEQSYRAAKLEQHSLQLELDFLKSQISPHFLFNTLTNIYQMAKESHADTPETVLRLAHLMRYILHESKQELIPIRNEIDFLQNYIELARIRYEKSLPVVVEIVEPQEPYTVAPLLLIPFVENAFKHGPNRSLQNAWVTISLAVENDQLVLTVANGLNPLAKAPPQSGIGLENAKRRLMQYYPERHELETDTQVNKYQVTLMLTLK